MATKCKRNHKMNKIIYLDAAASSLKSDSVINAQTDFLRNKYANSGRGICARAAAVDSVVYDTRRAVANFIGATTAQQIIFTSGTTDSMNRIARILTHHFYDKKNLVVGVSDLDHHSARLPWVGLGVKNVVCPLDSEFNIDASQIPSVDILVITAMSNVLGMPQDVSAIVRAARAKNPDVITVVDAAQYVVHLPIDVKNWDCDFLCFSGHKIGTDTGVGIMYIKNPARFLPDKFGGGMVNRVLGADEFIPNDAPDKFEAGTLPLTQIAGFIPAIEYLQQNRPNLDLIKYLYDELSNVAHIKILSPRESSLFSFVVDNMHVLDFGAIMGANNVCLRVGNMCASWIHKAQGISGSARISVGPWNNADEIRNVVRIIKSIVE